ncbi:MAG: hypothetical protein JO287_14645 [Pseudonocardiales bacterium]|nr:hypothetical protein [Pseudonocardiales bacterium]
MSTAMYWRNRGPAAQRRDPVDGARRAGFNLTHSREGVGVAWPGDDSALLILGAVTS